MSEIGAVPISSVFSLTNLAPCQFHLQKIPDILVRYHLPYKNCTHTASGARALSSNNVKRPVCSSRSNKLNTPSRSCAHTKYLSLLSILKSRGQSPCVVIISTSSNDPLHLVLYTLQLTDVRGLMRKQIADRGSF